MLGSFQMISPMSEAVQIIYPKSIFSLDPIIVQRSREMLLDEDQSGNLDRKQPLFELFIFTNAI